MPVIETDWLAVQDSLKAWISALSGAPTFYRDENVPHMPRHLSGRTRMLLSIQSIDERGSRTYGYDLVDATPGAGLMSAKVDRLLTVALEVSCQSGFNTPGTLAIQQLARCQLKAQHPGMQSDLLDCVELNRAGPISFVELQGDDWCLSQATSTWVLSVRDTYQDTDVTVETLETAGGDPATGLYTKEP